jgi:biopolymer transport protein ExbB/TolQ
MSLTDVLVICVVAAMLCSAVCMILIAAALRSYDRRIKSMSLLVTGTLKSNNNFKKQLDTLLVGYTMLGDTLRRIAAMSNQEHTSKEEIRMYAQTQLKLVLEFLEKEEKRLEDV